MKKYIKASEGDEHIDLGRRFGCRWSATIQADGKEFVQSSHPYDLSNYHYAYSTDGGYTFNICIQPEPVYNSPRQQGPKLVEVFEANPDQEYEDVIVELAKLDKTIQPRIDRT